MERRRLWPSYSLYRRRKPLKSSRRGQLSAEARRGQLSAEARRGQLSAESRRGQLSTEARPSTPLSILCSASPPPPVNLATFPSLPPDNGLLTILSEPFLDGKMGQTALTSPHLIMLGQAPTGKLHFCKKKVFNYFLGVLECVGHSFA